MRRNDAPIYPLLGWIWTQGTAVRR